MAVGTLDIYYGAKPSMQGQPCWPAGTVAGQGSTQV